MTQPLLSEEVKQKWEGIITAEGVAPIEDATIRNTTIRMLENTVNAVDEANGVGNVMGVPATGSGANASGAYDPVLISMVRRTMPSLIAHDLVGVQPMSGPTGLIFAMKAYYGGAGSAGGATEAFALNRPNSAHAAKVSTTSAENLGTGAQVDATSLNTAEPVLPSNPWSEMSFEISKVSVTADSRALKAKYTMELAQDLRSIHGMDAEAELSNILSTEVVSEINREMINGIRDQAKYTAGKTTQAIGIVGAGGINTTGNGFTDLVAGTVDPTSQINVTGQFNIGGGAGVDDAASGRWVIEKYKLLYLQLVRESIKIAQETRRGVGNTVICSPMVAAALEQVSKLDTGMGIGTQNQLNQDFIGASYAGILGGRFKLFVDPYATEDFCTLGYKGSNVYDAGIFYCPYVPLQTMKSVGEEDFQPRIGMKTRYGIAYNPFVADPRILHTNQYYREFVVVGA